MKKVKFAIFGLSRGNTFCGECLKNNGELVVERELLSKMKDDGNTRITEILCSWGDSPDFPSYDFREMMLELDPANADARMLLRDSGFYHTPPFLSIHHTYEIFSKKAKFSAVFYDYILRDNLDSLTVL